MTRKRFRIMLLSSTVVLLLLAMAAESLYFSDFEYKLRTRRVNRILHEKEVVMQDCLNELNINFSPGDPHGSVTEKNIFSLAERNEITILEYFDGKLVYWSDNGFDVPVRQNDALFSRPLLFLQNGWFLPATVQSGNEMFVGLLRVRTDYGFENDIIKNGYVKDFRLIDAIGFSTQRDSSGYEVFNRNGAFLFSLVFPEIRQQTSLTFIPLVLWGLVFFSLIMISLMVVRIMTDRSYHVAGIFFCFLIFASVYTFLLIAKSPATVFGTTLFSHFNFSLNSFIPSLGHLLVLSFMTAIISYVAFRYIDTGNLSRGKPIREYFTLISFLLPGAVVVSVIHLLFSQLISASNISFEPYKVLNLTQYSAFGLISVMLLLLAPVFLLMKLFRSGNSFRNPVVILSLITSLALLPLLKIVVTIQIWPVALFYSCLVLTIWLATGRKMNLFNMSVLFSALLALYSLYLITRYSAKKNIENLKIQAVTFATDNDPEAEHMLLDMWPVISSDPELGRLMDLDFFDAGDFERISGYLNEVYFDGYWGNYNINIYLCKKDQLLRLDPDGENLVDCFTFFNTRIARYGHQLTGTEFYFIDNQAGRSAYLGRMEFESFSGLHNGLFIELYSDVHVFEPGYTELLLDKKFKGYSGLKENSFAKYINGEIVLTSGEYPYYKSDVEYIGKDLDYRIFVAEGYRHVLYRNGNTTIMISNPVTKPGDVIISFAYLFAFIYLFASIVVLILRRPAVSPSMGLNFRQKLQLSFIGILTFSFILIGIVVASLTVEGYKAKHYENIKEKLNSIYMELENKISAERELSPGWHSIQYASPNEMLIKLSNIFKTDINLYDVQGFLVATSRPEIFARNLDGKRMNNTAFTNLKDLTKSEFIHSEKIGNLEYVSVYTPFFNNEGKLLTYLNLPYFRMQSLLAREISNLIVAVINFTLLLILITMSLGVFISTRLTSPLSMLSEGMASVELGKKSKHLTYKSSDEIGEIVKQYNLMVDELEESARKLTNSEREYAWREMAKQIAHEIKNPLTPMKLNVQQLLKSWKDGAPGFDKRIEAFSLNQIEYIDNLSTIATAFSSFAKMPGTNPNVVNLPDHIKTTLELFKSTDNLTFRVKWPHESKVFIYADKEHLNGIFSNIFKNSIQAMPQEREGIIKVAMEVKGDKVYVSVSDNGNGIPESLKNRMFTPNFTTKSSGTGLGLSIVKKYVEGANGRIWFESVAGEGTTFHIEFPLLYTVEKPGEATS